jgi:hypothetical protein
MKLIRNRWILAAVSLCASVLSWPALGDFYDVTNSGGRSIAVVLLVLGAIAPIAQLVRTPLVAGVLHGITAMGLAMLLIGGFTSAGVLLAVAASYGATGLSLATRYGGGGSSAARE